MSVNAAQNIEKCIRRCGLEVDDIILEQLASSYSALTEDERELGVCLVDIGGGTTDIAIFEGSIRHTGVIPIAGDQVTNDIAMAVNPHNVCRRDKNQSACALAKLTGADEVYGARVGDRPARSLSRQALAEVVEPRYDELFTLVQAGRRGGYGWLRLALCSLEAPLKWKGRLILQKKFSPVRLGAPQGIKGLADIVANPIYATGVGLLQYGMQQGQQEKGIKS